MNFSSNYDVYKEFFYVKNEQDKLGIPSISSETKQTILNSAIVCTPVVASIIYGSHEVITGLNHQPDFYSKIMNFVNDSLSTSDKNTFLALAATAITGVAIPLVCAIPALKKAVMDTTDKIVDKVTEYKNQSVYFQDSQDLISHMKKEYKNSDNLLPFKTKNSHVVYPQINIQHDKIRSDYSKSIDLPIDDKALEQYCFLNLVSSVRQSRIENKELLCYSKINLVKALDYAQKTNFVWNNDDLKVLSTHINHVVTDLKTKLHLTESKPLSENEEFTKQIIQSAEFFTINSDVIKSLESSLSQIQHKPLKKTFSESLKNLVDLRAEHYQQIVSSNKIQVK